MKKKFIHKCFISGLFFAFFLAFIFSGCHSNKQKAEKKTVQALDSMKRADSLSCCSSGLPARPYLNLIDSGKKYSGTKSLLSHGDMVIVPGGTFTMGGDSLWGRPDEFPKHKVQVSSFYMDKHEVTNAQFRAFVEATGYVTTAEQKPDWEEIKKQLPAGTPKPAESLLVAASLVFSPPNHAVSLSNASIWWSWVPGASWQHPEGPKSNIDGKGNYPVVQVSWDDAVAYSRWAGKRLPTEAEWEYASRGGKPNSIYPWGDEPVSKGKIKANTWQGNFPNNNTENDKFYRTSPVEHFSANGYGLYDMAGNVWEWCSDWYRPDYYAVCAQKGLVTDPKGPADSYDPDEGRFIFMY